MPASSTQTRVIIPGVYELFKETAPEGYMSEHEEKMCLSLFVL